MQNRLTLEEFGPIMAALPADWPQKEGKKPRREGVGIVQLEPIGEAKQISSHEGKKTQEAYEVEELFAESAPMKISDEDADVAVGVCESPAIAPEPSEAMAVTGSDKLEGVLDTLPDEIVRFIEDQMRARFVKVKIIN